MRASSVVRRRALQDQVHQALGAGVGADGRRHGAEALTRRCQQHRHARRQPAATTLLRMQMSYQYGTKTGAPVNRGSASGSASVLHTAMCDQPPHLPHSSYSSQLMCHEMRTQVTAYGCGARATAVPEHAPPRPTVRRLAPLPTPRRGPLQSRTPPPHALHALLGSKRQQRRYRHECKEHGDYR